MRVDTRSSGARAEDCAASWQTVLDEAERHALRAQTADDRDTMVAAYDQAAVTLAAAAVQFRQLPSLSEALMRRAQRYRWHAGQTAPRPVAAVEADGHEPSGDFWRAAAARTATAGNRQVSMQDVVGAAAAKRHVLTALRLPLQLPQLFKGERKMWRGILMYGPPGTGKTLLAEAAAHTVNCKFYCVSSKDIMQQFLGQSEKFVSALFAEARAHAPAIIFLDEVDALLGHRHSQEHDARRSIKTQFFADMDGFNRHERVTVVGATNRPWDLDEAASRRFEKHIFVPLPDRDERQALFAKKLTGLPHTFTSYDLQSFAAATPMYSGADITNVVKDAALAQPIRLGEAAYLRRNEEGRLTPCTADAPGAERAPTDLSALQGETLDESVRLADVMQAIAAHPATMSQTTYAPYLAHERRCEVLPSP